MNESRTTPTPMHHVGALDAEKARQSGGPLRFDASFCRTCKVCEIACSVAKERKAWPAMARMNIAYDEFRLDDAVTASLCFHCAEAECAAACPVATITRDEASGAIVIDEAECIGCMQCRDACPWQVPKYHPEKGVAVKCDLCRDRDQGPACVEACPLAGKALSYKSREDERLTL